MKTKPAIIVATPTWAEVVDCLREQIEAIRRNWPGPVMDVDDLRDIACIEKAIRLIERGRF